MLRSRVLDAVTRVVTFTGTRQPRAPGVALREWRVRGGERNAGRFVVTSSEAEGGGMGEGEESYAVWLARQEMSRYDRQVNRPIMCTKRFELTDVRGSGREARGGEARRGNAREGREK